MKIQQNIPEPAKKIRISQSTLQDPENVATFISIHGRKKYLNVLEQFAEARHGSGKLEEIETFLQNHDVSDEEYKELRKELQKEQAKMVGPKDEAYAEVSLDGYETDEQFRQRFLKLHGKENYLAAQGLQGLETANNQALKNIHPYVAGNIDKQRHFKEQAAESERKKAEKKAAMEKIKGGEDDN